MEVCTDTESTNYEPFPAWRWEGWSMVAYSKKFRQASSRRPKCTSWSPSARVPLVHSTIPNECEVTGRLVQDVGRQCVPIRAGFCASALEEEMPWTCKVLSDYSSREERQLLWVASWVTISRPLSISSVNEPLRPETTKILSIRCFFKYPHSSNRTRTVRRFLMAYLFCGNDVCYSETLG